MQGMSSEKKKEEKKHDLTCWFRVLIVLRGPRFEIIFLRHHLLVNAHLF